MDSPWMTPKQAAQYLAMSVSQLAAWRTEYASTGPDFYRVGRFIRYNRQDLDEWLSGYRTRQHGGTPYDDPLPVDDTDQD